MRIRLFLDTEMSPSQIMLLQEIIADQPEVIIQIMENFPILGARLMGATPVELVG